MSRILITIPVWNESIVIRHTIDELIRVSRELLYEHRVMIEIVDNGSTDGTEEIVREVIQKSQEKNVVFTKISQKGKGIAIRSSWSAHLDDTDVLVFTDADLAADITFLPKLIAPILSDQADLVCGSRFVVNANVQRKWLREILSHLFRLYQSAILHLPVQDAQCGFKAISSRAVKILLPKCQENGWLFDSELIAFADNSNFRVQEIPVSWVETRHIGRRSALRVWLHGWGFLTGLWRIRKKLLKNKQKSC